MNQETGKWIIVSGVILILAGLIVYFSGDKLNWIGKLPGDIYIKREGFTLYFPIVTLLLCSIVISVLIRVIRYLFE